MQFFASLAPLRESSPLGFPQFLSGLGALREIKLLGFSGSRLLSAI
jgi:hypothetical protein